MLLSGPTSLLLTALNATSIEVKWSNPKQNTKDLTAPVKYKDTDTTGSPEESMSGSVETSETKALLSALQPNTIYSADVCICKKAGSGKCACVAKPVTAATKPLGKRIISPWLGFIPFTGRRAHQQCASSIKFESVHFDFGCEMGTPVESA